MIHKKKYRLVGFTQIHMGFYISRQFGDLTHLSVGEVHLCCFSISLGVFGVVTRIIDLHWTNERERTYQGDLPGTS